jgi:Bacterial protein of unknown function (DUF894).
VLASIGWNIARALGPGIGGLIIALAGVPAAFAVNALCNVYIIGVLLSWYWKSPMTKPKAEQGLLSELIAGFAHVHATATIRAVMLRCFVSPASPARSGPCCRWSPSGWPAAPRPMACCWARWASARSSAPG